MQRKKSLTISICILILIGVLILVKTLTQSLSPTEIAKQDHIERRSVKDPILGKGEYAFLELAERENPKQLARRYLYVNNDDGGEKIFHLLLLPSNNTFYLAEPHWDRPILPCKKLSVKADGGKINEIKTIHCLDSNEGLYDYAIWDFHGNSNQCFFENLREYEFEKTNEKIIISKKTKPNTKCIKTKL